MQAGFYLDSLYGWQQCAARVGHPYDRFLMGYVKLKSISLNYLQLLPV